MEFRAYVIFSIVLVVSLARNTVCLPKDDTVVKKESLPVTQEFAVLNAERKPDQKVIVHESPIPGRMWCQHEGPEPAEDRICEEHCIPKGYSYGLCVSNMCSCI
ncbi:hypothetical protein evm_004873 [Chilo suppressalis]|nr:hypothetical protein evm_004873 [Chilo suppressalis]